MEKAPVKTEAQIEAEKQEAIRLIEEINQRINKVPGPVMEGSVQRARSWKEQAFKAMKLAQSKQPKLDSLRNAVQALRHFDKAAA